MSTCITYRRILTGHLGTLTVHRPNLRHHTRTALVVTSQDLDAFAVNLFGVDCQGVVFPLNLSISMNVNDPFRLLRGRDTHQLLHPLVILTDFDEFVVRGYFDPYDSARLHSTIKQYDD